MSRKIPLEMRDSLIIWVVSVLAKTQLDAHVALLDRVPRDQFQ